jgi:hypothetical protein
MKSFAAAPISTDGWFATVRFVVLITFSFPRLSAS